MRRKGLALVLLCLFAGSCGPATFVHPLSDLEAAKPDEALTGVWACKVEGQENTLEAVWLHFIPRGDQATDLIIVFHKRDGARAWPFRIFPVTIGGKKYMSVKPLTSMDTTGNWKAEYSKTYWVAKYEISKDGILRLWYADDEPAAKSIEAGELKGKFKKEQSVGGARFVALAEISSDTAELRKFLSRADAAKLFAEFGKYVKVVVPAPDEQAAEKDEDEKAPQNQDRPEK